MLVTVYGSHFCSDTRSALDKFKEAGVEIDFRDISEGLDALKEFLILRDSNPLYEEVKKNGYFGMPFFRMEDGRETFDIGEVLKAKK
jgi:glutaredoxin-related protein